MTGTETISRGAGLRMTAGRVALLAAVLVACAPALAAPAAGDTYVYQVVDGYNKEVRGKLQYQVERVDADRITVSVNSDNPNAGWAHSAVFTREGNWLRNLVSSHSYPLQYDFAAAYPAYVFPLDPGKTWSLRVNATAPGTDIPARSVRVDGSVIGNERIRVPAGEFDAVKVRRLVYTGDADNFRTETRVIEFDWYVPALGRPVRTERRSDWLDFSQCDTEGSCDFYGNWDIIELIGPGAAKR